MTPEPIPVPSEPSQRPLVSLRSVAASWLCFAAFYAWLASHPAAVASFFCLFLPLSLLICAVQELYRPGQGVAAGYAALGSSLLLPIFVWSRIGRTEVAVVFADLALGAALLQIADAFFARMARRIGDCRRQIGETRQNFKTILQQNHFYVDRLRQLKSQIGTRQGLYAFSREIGNLLDPDLIQGKLLERVRVLFPSERVTLLTSPVSDDAVDRWLIARATSCLVKDSAEEGPVPPALADLMNAEGGPKVRSLIAVPMVIERNFMGLVRVDSDQPGRFQEVDLQQLELYAHISTLALENARLFEKVNAMATRDGLTGLATHRVFQEKLTDEIQRAARYHTPLSLVMLDIDHFKSVNDNHGHLAGDEVLKEVARVMLEHCRPVDFAARYGGEEFCLILPEVGLSQARRLAESLREKISGTAISLSRERLSVTASLGCASFPDEAQTPAQLIRTADQRLYRAKTTGRNKVIAA